MWQFSVNFLAVLVAAIATMVIGFIWYAPNVFGRLWSRALGKDPDNKEQMDRMRKSAGPAYVMVLIGSLVTAAVMGVFINTMGLSGVMSGLAAGFLAWLGFSAPLKIASVMFGGQGKDLIWIDGMNSLVNFLVTGAILAAWK